MADWQTIFYPTCNMLHELPLIDSDDYKVLSRQSRNRTNSHQEDEASVILLNTKGSWRSVWKVAQQQYLHPSNNEPQNIVLKTLRYNREFDEESFQLQIIDSMAMERLTSSPYIANEYGFCGQSVLTEYAPKSGRDLIKNKRLKSWQRLEIAHDLAAALADMHSIDYPNATNATLTHNDINIANTIQGEPHGRIKFNDFNIGVKMRWNHTKPCGYPVHFNAPLWRSPEEILATNTTIYVQPEKSDMYALGNLLFQVLTTHQPWTWLEPEGRLSVEQVIRKKLAGEYPHIPSKFQSNTTGVQAIYHATMSCFAHAPEDRPTSFELAEALQVALEWSKQGIFKTDDDIRHLFDFVQQRNKP
jgi:serine/threonine protein kinase